MSQKQTQNPIPLQRPPLQHDLSERVVKIDLDEQVILATNEDGSEQLRLSFSLSPTHEIRVQFPTLGSWDSFCNAMSRLFLLLVKHASNFEIPDDYRKFLNDKEGYLLWAAMGSAALRPKAVSNLLLEILCKYLRPELPIKSKRWRAQRRWIRQNASVDALIKIFAAVLAVDDWVKKNALSALSKIFRMEMPQPSTRTSAKSGAGRQNKPKENQFSQYDNFLDIKPNMTIN